MLKKILSHSLIYALGPQVPKLASLFVLPIITKYLTSNDYGIYGLVTSYSGLFSAMSDLGFSVLLVNSFFKFPVKWPIIWRQLHFYLFIWSWIYAVLVGVVLYFVLPIEPKSELGIVVLLVTVPTCLFNPTILIGSRYFQFAQKPFYVATTSAIVGVITIGLNLLTIAYLKMGYIGWFISMAFSTFVQFLFFVYPVYFKYKLQPLLYFRKRFLFKQLKVSLPTVPHNYSAYLLSNSDRVVMDRVGVSVSNVGRYNIAYMFGNYFEFFGNAIGMAVGPVMTKLVARKTPKAEADFVFLTKWLQVSFLFGGIILALWAKELMKLLIKNNELNASYPLAIIIIMGYVYRPYYWAVICKLQFEEKTNQFWKISFIAGGLNVGLNIIFIPLFGIQAAAITTFFALIYMGFAGYFLRSVSKQTKELFQPGAVIGVIIVLSVLVYFLKDLNILSKSLITIIVGMLFLVYNWKKRFVFNNFEV